MSPSVRQIVVAADPPVLLRHVQRSRPLTARVMEGVPALISEELMELLSRCRLLTKNIVSTSELEARVVGR